MTVSIFYLLNDVLETNFVSSLAWLLLSSVLLPLGLSGVETAWRRPLVFLGSGGWARYSANPPTSGKLCAIRIFNVICCAVVPAVLINAKEEAKAKKEHILEKVKHQYDHPEEAGAREDLHQKLRDTECYLEESKEALLTYKRNELSIENSIQISIQVLMLLLSPTYSTFITHSGLQAVFQKDFAVQTEIQAWIENLSGLSFNLTQWFLVLSILWSMKTISLTYVKVKAAGKVEVLALPAKLLLALRSLFVYSVRLSCVVAFFGPFLGLFNVLAHWRAEQMVLEFKVFNRSQTFSSLEMSGSLPIDAIYRADYNTTDPENPLPPSYTLYTQVSLGTSFAFFLVLIVTQALVNLLLETKLSREFKEAGWTAKMQHLLESVNRADSFADWDTGVGTQSEFQRRWWNVMAETIVMIGVQMGTNLALLVPLWVTSKTLLITNSQNTLFLQLLLLHHKRLGSYILLSVLTGVFVLASSEILTFISHMCCHHVVDSEHTNLKHKLLIFPSMERPHEAPAYHARGVDGVQGGDRGLGAADPAQLGDAPHGLLHQLPRHPHDGSLPKVAPSLEKNPC